MGREEAMPALLLVIVCVMLATMVHNWCCSVEKIKTTEQGPWDDVGGEGWDVPGTKSSSIQQPVHSKLSPSPRSLPGAIRSQVSY